MVDSGSLQLLILPLMPHLSGDVLENCIGIARVAEIPNLLCPELVRHTPAGQCPAHLPLRTSK